MGRYEQHCAIVQRRRLRPLPRVNPRGRAPAFTYNKYQIQDLKKRSRLVSRLKVMFRAAICALALQ